MVYCIVMVNFFVNVSLFANEFLPIHTRSCIYVREYQRFATSEVIYPAF